jgi:hypothetical protein
MHSVKLRIVVTKYRKMWKYTQVNFVYFCITRAKALAHFENHFTNKFFKLPFVRKSPKRSVRPKNFNMWPV